MKRQNDWYTGIDYYNNSKEKQVHVEKKAISEASDLIIHEKVLLLYVMSGSGVIEINGIDYKLERGSFLCLYMHHFYKYKEIFKSLDIVEVSFYIGNFMFMCFERHPMNANETLVYDTCPHISLDGKRLNIVENRVESLLLEKEEQAFSSMNLIIYITLELHAYFCRYAFENVTSSKLEKKREWQIIPEIILSVQKDLSLEDIAKANNLSKYHLNQKIKKACGMTYFQLNKFGKITNACALLHFPELSMDYISDILNFSSKSSFYKVFKQHMAMSPKEYQLKCVLGDEDMLNGYSNKGILFLQYMHLNFMNDISLESLASEFYIKEYTARLIFKNVFNKSFNELLSEIRISYACSFLSSTDKSVTEIYDICKFESLSTFQRDFKKQMNQSPSEYRKNLIQGFDNKTSLYD